MRLARRILVHCDQARYAAAFDKHLAHAMARRLGRGHAHINARRRHNGLEVNVEAVRKHQHLAGGDVGADLVCI